MNEEELLTLIETESKLRKAEIDNLQNQINQIRLKMDKIYERLK